MSGLADLWAYVVLFVAALLVGRLVAGWSRRWWSRRR